MYLLALEKRYSATSRHQEALQILEEAFVIAEEIEDSVVLSSLHIRLAEEYLTIRDAEAAAEHVAFAANERPEDADSLKVQAHYEATVGNVQGAATLMGLTRSNAGEGWNEADAAMLAEYRAAAGSE